jgi:hypothetical protein
MSTALLSPPVDREHLLGFWDGTFYIAHKLFPLHVKIRRKSDGKLIKNRVHIHRLKHGFSWVDKPQEDYPPIGVDAI